MELNLQRRMVGLKEKIPDIEKTLDSVRFLHLRKVPCAAAIRLKCEAQTEIR